MKSLKEIFKHHKQGRKKGTKPHSCPASFCWGEGGSCNAKREHSCLNCSLFQPPCPSESPFHRQSVVLRVRRAGGVLLKRRRVIPYSERGRARERRGLVLQSLGRRDPLLYLEGRYTPFFLAVLTVIFPRIKIARSCLYSCRNWN